MRLVCSLLILSLLPVSAVYSNNDTLRYNVEMSANISSGGYAPLWFTANRYGLSGEQPNSGYLRTGVYYGRQLSETWRIEAGLDVAGALNHTSAFAVQQAYADVSWKGFTISAGSKERGAFPLDKDLRLSSGMMVEGPNARPVPQIRLEVNDYLDLPFTGGWLAAKGHFGYGWLTDGGWRESFVSKGMSYTRDIVYHSKSIMFRVGNPGKFPLTMEIGMIEAAQFGGSQWKKNSDGTVTCVRKMPSGIKEYFRAIIPVQKSTLENIEGNHVGSWNFAMTYNAAGWKARCYYEHYFDDHSQLTWQYGRWKDGHIGLELTLPDNRWVSAVLWEGLATADQTGPILYDGVGGSFHDVQMSGRDNYYNHEYLWQHWGEGLGHPFLPGPVYNKDGRLFFRSNRVKAQHIGVCGRPSDEWQWRVLLSYVRHWGTYSEPLDRMMRQGSTLFEASFQPRRAHGWSFTLGCGIDRGSYLGDSTGGMITIRKNGILWSR